MNRIGLIAFAALLASCGGGTDGTGAPAPATGVVVTSSGVMTVGSVVLNGTRYDERAAVVVDDRERGMSGLADGTVIRLRGRIDGTARAERIEIENELRAVIAGIDPGADPQRFVAAGVTVLLASDTVFAGGSLAAGVRVEVHGLRDLAGHLRASRIEIVGPGQGLDELRGSVSALNLAADTFVLNGNVTVSYAGARFVPPGAVEADLTAGARVEVRGSLTGSAFAATEVVIDARQKRDFDAAPGERQDVEGYVTGFSAHPGSFRVDGRAVMTTAGTQFDGGSASDLANDVRIEAIGTADAQGVLVLTHVEFKNARVTLQGWATRVQFAPPLVEVLRQGVRVNDLTRIEARDAAGAASTRLTDIAAGVDCIEVLAFTAGPLLFADLVREVPCGSDRVQAPVSAKNESAATLTYFGTLNALLDGAGVVFRDASGTQIPRAQFFAAVMPPAPGRSGTTVRTTGVLGASGLAAAEAQVAN